MAGCRLIPSIALIFASLSAPLAAQNAGEQMAVNPDASYAPSPAFRGIRVSARWAD